ncbi:aromatic ring-hydroxylating dioxygenase subunit alpha [Aestuariicella hydrocarbonica]|uniref:Aromatic ring-hydroxylating dioxygenase subunit alpha n=1 Tax=Pseudomaricurvus hydrocarbonicus TaxID=1470433 RepID=A0A9E5MHE5_9GAMM|nr:aromatic ring-hydroxylating dioxygenase subunit alpha [Aestuariicella hydrocarbonica]NHO65841.1 aromatic ring-hydroxylating dioxygenase subunit alpha [Aestuariicella hydrocarbonica]
MKIDVKNIDVEQTQQHGLPPEVFKATEIFDKECDAVFRQGWVSLASAQQLPEVGDMLPVKIGNASLLIMRGADDTIGVFHNICRHKAAPLVDSACRKRVLVCPYHRWAYNLDGSLRAAPKYYGDSEQPMSAQDKADKGLLPVRSAVWWDTIFVNLSGDAEPFEEFIRPLDQLLEGYDSDGLRMISTTEYQSSANWKLAVDNFLDGYHVPFVHSQAVTLDSVMNQEDLFLSDNIAGLRLPTGASDKPAKTDKPLPHFRHLTEENVGTQQWFGIFPNTLLFVDPVWVQLIIVRPEAPTAASETLTIYAANPESMADEFAPQREALSAALNEVNQQDIELLDKLQFTRTAPEASQGHLVQAWDQVNVRFHQMWLQKMQAAEG